jgi:hypothetical protein
MTRYRKLPVEVRAWQFDPAVEREDWPAWMHIPLSGHRPIAQFRRAPGQPVEHLLIHTLEGNMMAQPGDWIVQGVEGELYPVKADIFAKTYELVMQETGDGGWERYLALRPRARAFVAFRTMLHLYPDRKPELRELTREEAEKMPAHLWDEPEAANPVD